MFLENDEAASRLTSENNLTHKLLDIRKLHTGRGTSDNLNPLEEELVHVISATANQTTAADLLGLAKSTVSQRVNGKNGKRSSKTDETIKTIHDQALEAMVEAITRTKELVPFAKTARDASGIAANLAKVIEKTSPKTDDSGNRVQVIVYSPRVKGEAEYESIDV